MPDATTDRGLVVVVGTYPDAITSDVVARAEEAPPFDADARLAGRGILVIPARLTGAQGVGGDA